MAHIPQPPRKSSYSMSLKKIIQDVEKREGRSFGGFADVCVSKEKLKDPAPRYPRPTRQANLDITALPSVRTDDDFIPEGAGSDTGDRPAPHSPGQLTGREDLPVISGPDTITPAHNLRTTGYCQAVLSLLPLMPKLQDEAFLLLYLDSSREFEKRFGASGWYDKVLTMAARGR